MKSLVKAAIVLMLIWTGLGMTSWGTAKTYAAAVSISQSGDVVTATNGTLTVTYDLSTGKGDLQAGSTTILSDFYSDYTVSGSSTRISSYDAGTRTASWTTIGSDGYGTNGKKLAIASALTSGSTVTLNLTMYEDKPFLLADMTVENGTSQTIDFLEPIAANNLDIGAGSDKRIYTTPYTNNYDFGVAPVDDFGDSENGYDRTASSPPVTWGPFNGTSYWVAAMFDNTNKHGFIAGAATTPNWKSMEYLRQAATANGPLTGFSVYNAGGSQSGTTVASDRFFLGYYDDYQDGLEQFGSTYAVGEPGPSWSGGVPKGFNTYYSFQNYPTVEAMQKTVDYFAAQLKPLGYTYMNLDCCYRGATTPAATVTDLTNYSSYVHSKGMKAGNYSAPFAIFDQLTDPIPGAPTHTFGEIALKDAGGNAIVSYLNTYIVDATNPLGQDYLKYLMDTYFVDAGFDYAKLDFLDFGMMEGNHYDSAKNGMQSYRMGMQVMKDELLGAGRPIFIDESIAPLLPSGYAHGRRSGVDTSIGMQSYYTGVERQAFNAAASWWTNGTLYTYNDPDMLLPANFINGFNQYPFTEGRLLTTAVMLSGAHLLIGDNVPFLTEDRMSPLLNPSLLAIESEGKTARPVRMTNFYHQLEHAPPAVYLTEANGDKIVGLSNWDRTDAASQTISFADLGLSPSATYTVTELYSGTKIGTFSGSYTRNQQPGESVILRISASGSSLPTPPANLAAGKSATASTVYSAGYEASKVTDGDLTTRWSADGSSNNDQWVEVDFGAATSVNRVVVKEYGYGSQNFQIDSYRLQYWNGSSYVDLMNGFTLGDVKTIDFPTVSTTKIRLYATRARFLPSINEIEAYNVPGNTGYRIDQDDSTSAYSTYSDIRAHIQRMQTFSITQSSLPKIDVFLYESYVNKLPEDNLYVDIVQLDASGNPAQTLFTAALPPFNVQGGLTPYAIYPKLTGLDPSKQYGLILRSPGTVDDSSTSNKYGFGYSDSNPYPDGEEKLSTDGGATWSAESGGDRDLTFAIYK